VGFNGIEAARFDQRVGEAGMAPDRESRSENARRQASPIVIFLAGLLLVAAYPLSLPFVFALCHSLGVDFDPIRDTVYAPIKAIAIASPDTVAPLETYCDFVIGMLGIRVP
jgi:hypothetical protein